MNLNLVVGVGSPHGDDQIGWRLIEFLRFRHSATLDSSAVSLQLVSDPVNMLVHLTGIRRLVVADACQLQGPAGTIRRFEWPEMDVFEQGRHSTHHVSLVQTLQLAEALGRLPPEVVIFGLEIERSRPGSDVSAGVEAALPEMARHVLGEFPPGELA